MKLVIGNKNYSSWSLRPWIGMKAAGIAFDEEVIPLYAEGSREQILKHSPAGKVPVLIDVRTEELPKNASGKTLKNVLREQLRAPDAST